MAHKDVVDTHALIWYLEGNPRLGAAAKGRIDAPDSEPVLPIIALAEAAWVVERHRSSIPSVVVLLERVQADPRIEVYDLTLEVFRRSLTLQVIPELHDRLIVATAQQSQRALVTMSPCSRLTRSLRPRTSSLASGSEMG